WGAAADGAEILAIWLSGDSDDPNADGWRAFADDDGAALAASLIGSARRRLLFVIADDAAAPGAQAPGVGLIARAAQAAGAQAAVVADDAFTAAIAQRVQDIAPDAVVERRRSEAEPALRIFIGDSALAIEGDDLAKRRVVTRDRERLHIDALERRGWKTHVVRSLPWRLDPEREATRLKKAIADVTSITAQSPHQS
ncbi:MAG: hypothetical protein AAF684_01330, partial [Pseudomonadota bacterium]